MTNLMISGINGNMGKQVYDCALERKINIVCGIDKATVRHIDCPVYKSFDEVKNFVDVIVDFSSPELTDKLLDYALTYKIPVVICTTGLNQNHYEKINRLAKEVAVFQSENTAFGVFILFKLVNELANAFKNYDIEIIEKHHKEKVDSPSGTVISLIDSMKRNLDENLTSVYGRKGKTKRAKREIGIHSIRGGGIVGEHQIHFLNEDESFCLTHTANSKRLFAKGALDAVEFIKDKKFGLYSLDSIYKLK